MLLSADEDINRCLIKQQPNTGKSNTDQTQMGRDGGTEDVFLDGHNNMVPIRAGKT